MNAINRYRYVWILVLLLTFCSIVFSQDRIDVSNTQEILVTSVMKSERFGNQQKGDEALLIRDKAEVQRFVALFNNNLQAKVHACGYNWRLTFYRSAGAPPTEVYFNENCEEFERNTGPICELVQKTFKQTVTKPNAFLTNLKIDVTAAPDVARDDLSSKGHLRVLSLRHVQRLPYVELLASSTSPIPKDKSLWNAEKAKTVLVADQILVNDIARVRSKYHVVDIDEIRHSKSISVVDKIFEERRVALYFDVGTDIGSVGKSLNLSKVGSTVVPDAYEIQILTAARVTEPEKQELMKKFSFVKSVEPY
ncbi:MAG: hypothetical protein DMF63_00225 [Acidobacteria bacterium]|nr:MAG: hypothetical protein DMF63_00225 [Acidobacteriota bacterium]